MTFTDWINDRDIDSDCNVSQCPGDCSSPKQGTQRLMTKVKKTNIFYNKNMYFRATVMGFKGF